MNDDNSIYLVYKRQHVAIEKDTILYIISNGRNSDFHLLDGETVSLRCPLSNLEDQLGEDFIRIQRNCIVSVLAIHDVLEKIELSNGELLDYPKRKKKELKNALLQKRERIINSIHKRSKSPATFEGYKAHYVTFENMPFAFTDIEIIFNKSQKAVDWIFRYGNPALAELEEVPLDKLIGSSFSNIFPNMDSKWVRSYERATLYGETIEITDYSPEIDKNLKVICFPTFDGHCGCILFDLSKLHENGTSMNSLICFSRLS